MSATRIYEESKQFFNLLSGRFCFLNSGTRMTALKPFSLNKKPQTIRSNLVNFVFLFRLNIEWVHYKLKISSYSTLATFC